MTGPPQVGVRFGRSRIARRSAGSIPLIGRRSPDGAAGSSRLGSPIRIRLRFACVGIATAHRVLQIGNVGIAMSLIAAGQTPDRSPASRRAGGMHIPGRQRRLGLSLDTAATRPASATLVHFALWCKCVPWILRSSRIEIHSPTAVGRLGARRTVPRIGNRIKTFCGDGFAAAFANAIRAVFDAVERLTDFAGEKLLVPRAAWR